MDAVELYLEACDAAQVMALEPVTDAFAAMAVEADHAQALGIDAEEALMVIRSLPTYPSLAALCTLRLHQCLDDGDVAPVAITVRALNTLTALVLDHNRLTDDGVRTLADALTAGPHLPERLAHVDVRWNQTAEGALAALLRLAETLPMLVSVPVDDRFGEEHPQVARLGATLLETASSVPVDELAAVWSVIADALEVAEQDSVSTSSDDSRASAGRVSDEATTPATSPEGAFRGTHTGTLVTSEGSHQQRSIPRAIRNDAYDEEWIPSSDDDDDRDDASDDEASEASPVRSHATSARGTLSAGAPQPPSPAAAGLATASGALMPGPLKNHRLIFGAATPSADLLELYALVERYQPKRIDIPMKFMFPGPIGYMPAAHAPDPMLNPNPPAPIVKRPDRAPQEGRVEAQPPAESTSSVLSFIRSAQTSRANSPRTPVAPSTPRPATGVVPGRHTLPPVPPPAVPATARPNPRASMLAVRDADSAAGASSATSRGAVLPRTPVPPPSPSPSSTAPIVPSLNLTVLEHMDPLQMTLGVVNRAVCAGRHMLNYRSLLLPQVQGIRAGMGLAELMDDPTWAPGVRTHPQQILDDMREKKIDYNVVRRERPNRPRDLTAPRGYELELILRPARAENLSSGSMNTDGSLIATTHYDMSCRIWRTDTGERIHTLIGHENHLSDCAWNAPECDRLVTASFDKTLRIWNVADGALLHTLVGHELEVVCVDVAPGGRLCASGGMDDMAIIWDMESGDERHNLLGHEGEVIALHFSPDGSMLTTGSMDFSVRVWCVLTGIVLHKFEGHTAEVNQVRFNPFGNTVMSGSIDTTCRLWDLASGRSKVLRGHTHEVVDCDFSPDGWACVSASDDSTIRVWDVLTGGCTTLLVGHTQGVCRLVFEPSGKQVVSGSLDGTARVWDVASGECRQVLEGHKGLVVVAYNEASQRIITLSRDNTCRLWRLERPVSTLAGLAARIVGSQATLCAEAAMGNVLPAYLARLIAKMQPAEDRDVASKALIPIPGRAANTASSLMHPSPANDDDTTAAGTPSPAAPAGRPAGTQPSVSHNPREAEVVRRPEGSMDPSEDAIDLNASIRAVFAVGAE